MCPLGDNGIYGTISMADNINIKCNGGGGGVGGELLTCPY